MQFTKAVKKNLRARVAFDGPTKSGKTLALLQFFRELGGRTALIDTEEGTSRIYADEYDFDIVELNEDRSPQSYVQAIELAAKNGYANVGIDSLSHAWAGKGGVLSIVDRIGAKTGNKFTAWGTGSAEHQSLVDALLGLRGKGINLGITLRVHMEYVLEKNERGKDVPKKVGLKPIQREGMEYEFDVNASLNEEHLLTIAGTRCSPLDGKVFRGPNASAAMAQVFKEWMAEGKAEPTNGADCHLEPRGQKVPGASSDSPLPALEQSLRIGDAAVVERTRAALLELHQAGRLTKEDTERVGRLVNEAKRRLAAEDLRRAADIAQAELEAMASQPVPARGPAALREAEEKAFVALMGPDEPPAPAQAPAALLPEPEREPLRESIVEGLTKMADTHRISTGQPANESVPAVDGPACEKTMEILTDSMKANGIRSRDGVEKFVAVNAPGFTLNGLTESAANLLIEKLGEMGLERLSGAK